jgi:hypothetical protein
VQKIVNFSLIAFMGVSALYRWRQQRKFHALLYVVAANAWLASCNPEGDRHAG